MQISPEAAYSITMRPLPWMKKENYGKVSRANQPVTEKAQQSVMERIAAKLKLGKRLTREELEYLRDNNPELYAKAVEAEQERKAFRQELKACESQAEAQELYMHRLNSIKDEYKLAAVTDEFAAFVKSDDNKELSRRSEGGR